MAATNKRIWTVSNVLSVVRLILAIPVAFAILESREILVISLCAAAFCSDILDGYLARTMDEVTEFGKVIDPLADKIFVGVAVLALLVHKALPAWFVVLVIARDVLILAAGMIVKMRTNVVLMSNVFGKLTVVSIGLVIATALFALPAQWEWVHGAVEDIAVFMMAASVIVYGIRIPPSLRKISGA